jgi:hypothetical protein
MLLNTLYGAYRGYTMQENDISLGEIVKDHDKRIVKLERSNDVLSNKIDTTNKLLFSILTAILLFIVNQLLEKV